MVRRGNIAADAGGVPRSSQDVVARNLRVYGVANVVVRIVSATSVVVIARSLTSEDFGRYAVAIALSTLLTRMVVLGLGAYLVRETAQKPDRIGEALGHVMMLQGMLGIVALGACGAVAAVLGYDRETTHAVVLFAAGNVFVTLTASFTAVLIGLERARQVAGYQLAQAAVLALATVTAALAGARPAGIAAVSLAVSGLSMPFAIAMTRRYWRGIAFRSDGLMETLRAGTAYAATTLGAIMLTYVDAVMVQAFEGNVAAAQYGASYRLLLVAMIVPATYSDAATRTLAQLALEDRPKLGHLYSRMSAHLTLLGLPLAVGGVLVADDLMAALFGEEYRAAGTIAALLLAGLAVAYPTAMMFTTALGIGRERATALTYAGVVVFNVGANLVAIPAMGAEGAALVMFASQIVLLVVMASVLRRSGVRFLERGKLARGCGACLVMAGAMLLTEGLPLIVTLLAGVIAYAGALVALRVLDAEDAALLPVPLGPLVR